MIVFNYLIVLIVAGFSAVKCEYYTALSGMEDLIAIESVLATFLNKYIQEESDKLQNLKRFLDNLKNYHKSGYSSGEEFLSNPLNAILMLKRFRSDWPSIVDHMKNENPNRKEFLARYKSYGDFSYLPTDDDFKGAIDALMRLKDTYNLKVSAVANGIFNDVQYNVRLSASDCLEIGKVFYGQEDFFNSVKWFQQAYLKTDSANFQTKVDVLDYLSFSLYKTNDLYGAIKLTKSLLELDRNHSRAQNNLRIYLTLSNEKEWHLKNMKHDDGSWFLTEVSELTFVPKTYNYKDGMSDFKEYKKLCRKESKMNEHVESRLKCYYEHYGNPYLRIGPFKVEEAYLKPKILIYHDVLYDKEIERLKELAKPKFQRATVQNAVTGQLEVAEYRISKSAWLKNHDDPVVNMISKRIHLMTGLNMETAEELQVVNYGIGGHYEPHFDFARRDEKRSFESLGTGNRIATVLFYMTDVEQGGATVFPYLKTALWPKKGSAAFWYNLYASGEGDVLTRHAACPVLVGSKWVANKWLHFVGQEFSRPCNRTLDDFELKGYTI